MVKVVPVYSEARKRTSPWTKMKTILGARASSKAYIVEKAAQFELQRKEKINLTQYLNIYPLRDKLIGIATDIYNVLPIKSVYWESLRGGHALQKATKKGLIQYWLLTFEKKKDLIS